MFDLLAVGSFVAVLLCFFLPASADKKREDSTVHTETEIVQDNKREDSIVHTETETDKREDSTVHTETEIVQDNAEHS